MKTTDFKNLGPVADEPTVSVIIPTHNRPHFLEQAVVSVLTQTHKVLEIIIVDDGSDSIHVKAIERIARLRPVIRLYRHATAMGPGYARNFGMKRATGDYLLFLDDDDLLRPPMIARGVDYLIHQREMDGVTCGALTFRHARQSGVIDVEESIRVDGDDANPTETPVRFATVMRRTILMTTCLIRRNAIGDTFFPEDLMLGEDTYFLLSLVHNGCNIGHYDDTNVFIRRHRNNITSSKDWYYGEIQKYQRKLLNSGMITRRRDVALLLLQSAYFRFRQAPMRGAPLFGVILKYADIYIKGVFLFFRDRLQRRRYSFWRYV